MRGMGKTGDDTQGPEALGYTDKEVKLATGFKKDT